VDCPAVLCFCQASAAGISNSRAKIESTAKYGSLLIVTSLSQVSLALIGLYVSSLASVLERLNELGIKDVADRHLNQGVDFREDLF